MAYLIFSFYIKSSVGMLFFFGIKAKPKYSVDVNEVWDAR